MADKKSLFGMDSDDLADALEAIYKKQREHTLALEQISTALTEITQAMVAVRTKVITDSVAEGADDGVPPAVKWALSQPWGTQLMHSLTDQEMLKGLTGSLIDWLKSKAVTKVKELAAEAAAGAAK